MTIFDAFLALSLMAGGVALVLWLWVAEPEDLGSVSAGTVRRLRKEQ